MFLQGDKSNELDGSPLASSFNDEAEYVTGDEAVSRLREWCLTVWSPSEVDNADDDQIKDLFLRGTAGIAIGTCTKNNNLSPSDMQHVPVVETLALSLYLQRHLLDKLHVDGDSIYENLTMSTYDLIVSGSNYVAPSREHLGSWWGDFYNTRFLDFYS